MGSNFKFKIMEKCRLNKKWLITVISKRLQRFNDKKVIFVICFLISVIIPLTNLEAFNLKGIMFSNIPIHPSLKKDGEQSLVVNGVKFKTVNYQAENTDIPKIMEYYKKVLLQRGYAIEQEIPGTGYYGINFANKDKDIIRIMAYEGKVVNKPEYIFVTVTSNEDKLTKIADYFTNPDIDMPGEDIPWLERYPDSRRVSSIVVDNGMTTVNYLLDNESCVQCVVSFYKEQMLAGGWLFEGESYVTRDEMMQKPALDIDALKKQFKRADIPAEQKEVLEKTVEQLELAAEKHKESNMVPNETITLNFKKKEGMCRISVAYIDLKEKQGQFPQGSSEDIEKYIQSLPEEVGFKLKRVLGVDVEEMVSITAIYIPSSMTLRGQRRWF